MAILADADYFSIEALEAIQFRLIRGNLRRTHAAECKGHKGQHDILLAAKVRQLPVLPFPCLEGKVGRDIANFQGLRFRMTIACHGGILPKINCGLSSHRKERKPFYRYNT